MAFLHWPLEPRAAAPLLPPGTRADVLDGPPFAGLAALRMKRPAAPGGPTHPLSGRFR